MMTPAHNRQTARRAIRCILALIWLLPVLLMANSIRAESVLINKKGGHGLAIRHDGQCFVLTPRHVVEARRFVDLRFNDPAVMGKGTVTLPFWEGMDLAIVTVRGIEFSNRCRLGLDTLRGLRLDAEVGARLILVRLDTTGRVLELPARVISKGYQTFEIELTGNSRDDVIQTGTSGQFAFVEGQPVGMVLEQGGTDKTAVLMRIEEIAMNVDRRLNWRGVSLARNATESDPLTQAAGLPVVLQSVSAPGISTTHLADNLLTGPGAYVFEPNGIATIQLGFPEDETATLRRVRVISEPEQGFALPHKIEVLIKRGPLARMRTSPYATKNMSPEGIFDTGPGGGQTLRQLLIRIHSAQSNGPIKINRIIVE